MPWSCTGRIGPPPPPPPGEPTEVTFWLKSLQDCIAAARGSAEVWQRPASSDLPMMGPYLGALLKCVADRLAAEDRHHKGLLAFYPQQPAVTALLPNRHPPSMWDWNNWKQGLSASQPAQCQIWSHDRVG